MLTLGGINTKVLEESLGSRAIYQWTSRPWAGVFGEEFVGGCEVRVYVPSALSTTAIFIDLTLCLSDRAVSTASPGKIAQNKPSASALSLCSELSLPSHGHIPLLIHGSMCLSQSSLFLWCLLLVSLRSCFYDLSVFCEAWCVKTCRTLGSGVFV